MKTDVIIAGAGPVGLAMAGELARFGLSVRIVDKAPARTDKSKALVVWSRTLELLHRAGADGALIAAGQKAFAANFATADQPLARVPFDSVASPYPYALMIPQSETERVLEEHLAMYGVTPDRSVELLSFTDTGAGVTATLRKANGAEETVEANWLIGCDGAHSTVRHALGLEFVGDTQPNDWILADVHLANVPHFGEICILFHEDGVLALFPIKGDRYRIIADMGASVPGKPRLDPSMSDVQALLDRRGPAGIIASNPIWLAAFNINERKVKQYSTGRIFLAGDAAHIHSPAGGQGMNTGIQDACNLAWKLALVARGVCAQEPLLSSYSIERNAVGEVVLRNAGMLTKVGVLRGELPQALRNHLLHLILGLAPAQHRMADQMSELSIGYPKSPLTSSSSHAPEAPRAGERAPIRNDEPPVGAGGTPRFALFGESSNGAAQLIARFPALLEPALRKPFHEGGLWLVRPDGYVALAAKAEAWADVGGYLEHLTLPTP